MLRAQIEHMGETLVSIQKNAHKHKRSHKVYNIIAVQGQIQHMSIEWSTNFQITQKSLQFSSQKNCSFKIKSHRFQKNTMCAKTIKVLQECKKYTQAQSVIKIGGIENAHKYKV